MSTTTAAAPPRRSPGATLARAALALALLGALLVFVSGPGSRFGMWSFRTGFALMQYGAYAGVAGLVLGLAAAVLALRHPGRRGMGPALAAVLLGGLAFLPPFLFRRQARAVPPIHDITTDTRNPPPFVAIAPLRADAPNPVAYEGDSVAVQQQKAYPDVRPVLLPAAPDSAYGAALAAARGMGWEIIDVSRADGRIEASDRTFWYGFVDDVVIRVMPASGISRVDVRSKSRVGKSDVGANAERVRAYLERLREEAARRGIAAVEAGG